MLDNEGGDAHNGITVTDHLARPLLFVDVDGTLLPCSPAPLPSAPQGWNGWQSLPNPQLAKLDRRHGSRLLALQCDLVWATAWMQDANEVIAPLLGLPQLPVADLPQAPEEDQPGVLHWKTRTHQHAARDAQRESSLASQEPEHPYR
jgi:hypothetical protein